MAKVWDEDDEKGGIMERLVVTPKEAAEILFTSTGAVNTKCHTGEIPAYKDGKNWRIPIAVLEKYVVVKAIEEAAERRKGLNEGKVSGFELLQRFL